MSAHDRRNGRITAAFLGLLIGIASGTGCGGGGGGDDDDGGSVIGGSALAPPSLAQREMILTRDNQSSRVAFFDGAFEQLSGTDVLGRGNYTYVRAADGRSALLTLTILDPASSVIAVHLVFATPTAGDFTFEESSGVSGSGTFFDLKPVQGGGGLIGGDDFLSGGDFINDGQFGRPEAPESLTGRIADIHVLAGLHAGGILQVTFVSPFEFATRAGEAGTYIFTPVDERATLTLDYTTGTPPGRRDVLQMFFIDRVHATFSGMSTDTAGNTREFAGRLRVR